MESHRKQPAGLLESRRFSTTSWILSVGSETISSPVDIQNNAQILDICNTILKQLLDTGLLRNKRESLHISQQHNAQKNPRFDLGLCEAQRRRQFGAFWEREILGLLESALESRQLKTGVDGSRFPDFLWLSIHHAHLRFTLFLLYQNEPQKCNYKI